MVNLEIGYPEAHRHICGSMCLGEHILDLIAGFNVPFRYPQTSHGLLFIRLKTLSLSYLFHDEKGLLLIHTCLYQGKHYVLTGGYNLGQWCNFVFYKLLSIVDPYISSVRQSTYPDKFRKSGWFCFN